MPNKKISTLSELTAPVSGDWVPIVDTSAGTTKKIDIANLSVYINAGMYGIDATGVAESTTEFQAAAAALDNTLGGTILIPPGTYVAEDIPLDTGTPGFAPIQWIGSGDGSTQITLPSSPSASMFVLSTTGNIAGGCVRDMELVGDGTVAPTAAMEPDEYDATEDCIDMSSGAEVENFFVDGCYIHGFRRGYNAEASSRSPTFGNNRWWGNQTAVFIQSEHPLWSGVNDIRYNYYGISGDSCFDMICNNQKINYNYYGVMMTSTGSINTCHFSGTSLFKNKKIGIDFDGHRNTHQNSLVVPNDNPAISTITTSGDILTITTSTAHFMEVGDSVVFFETTGLTGASNDTEYTVTARTSSTVFTIDVGSAVSGSASDGWIATSLCEWRLNGSNNFITNNMIRDSANGRNGLGIVLFRGSSLSQWHKVSGNQFYGYSGSGAHKVTAIVVDVSGSNAIDGVQIVNNTFIDMGQAIRDLQGRLDRCTISSNTAYIFYTPGPGAGRDLYEILNTTYGNIFTDNFMYLTSTTSTGQYLLNIDSSRSVIRNNVVRYDASEYTAAFNISGYGAGDTLGVAGNGNITSSNADNSITSF